jgi:mRNA degradation ribonuclease J1/J2
MTKLIFYGGVNEIGGNKILIEDEVLHNWLNHFGMQFHQLHASGHLNREQIGQVIKEIDAKKVFPVHTENAPLFKKIAKNVQLPKREKSYSA